MKFKRCTDPSHNLSVAKTDTSASKTFSNSTSMLDVKLKFSQETLFSAMSGLNGLLQSSLLMAELPNSSTG